MKKNKIPRKLDEPLERKNPLSKEVRSEVIRLLNITLTDLCDIHSQLKEARWNLRGASFHELRRFLMEESSVIDSHIDVIAERIVQLGGYADAPFARADKGSRLSVPGEGLRSKSGGKAFDSKFFVGALRDTFALHSEDIRFTIQETASVGDTTTAHLLNVLSSDVERTLWILEASA